MCYEFESLGWNWKSRAKKREEKPVAAQSTPETRVDPTRILHTEQTPQVKVPETTPA